MKTQYKNNLNHRYCLGINPDYQAYLNGSPVFRTPPKYWVGVGKISDYGIEYDNVITTDDRSQAQKIFDEKTL